MNVYYNSVLVGTIIFTKENRISFSYAPEWMSRKNSISISHSLPMGRPWADGADHNFFINLLPEGTARELIARRFGISVENDFALLKALGRDCAGALTIGEPISHRSISQNPMNQEPINQYELINQQEFQRLLTYRLAIPDDSEGMPRRFSLAGAMNKWAVYLADQGLAWPKGDTPSTHILKLDPIEYKHVSFNEAFVSFLVKQVTIPVVSLEPYPQYSIIRRYDRFKDKTGLIGRRHQEDLAQALGYAPSRKYQREGGPSIAEVANLVRRVSTFPARDIEFLIKWQIMNALVGNFDGHAKNLSLVWEDGTLGLTPFYDLVSTGVYGGTTKELAFGFGGTHEVGQIRNANINQFAKDMGVSVKLVNRELQGIISIMKSQGRKSLEEFQQIYGSIQLLDEVVKNMYQTIRRLEHNLKIK